MMELDVQIDMDEFKREIEQERRTLLRNTELFADLVAKGVVNHARSTTGGATVKGAPRNSAGNYIAKANRTQRNPHPGGWADVTGALANSIKGTIETRGFSVAIVVEATMEYAAALDSKTGYDVLGGADDLARKLIKRHQHILFN